MTTKPPGANVNDLIAFAMLDELLRTLVSDGTWTADKAAHFLERVRANVRGLNLASGKLAVRVLEEMLREYRKQTG